MKTLPGPILFDRHTIARRVAELGAQIDADYAGTVPVLVTVLRGATIFASDLARALNTVHEMDFLAISSFGDEMPGAHARVVKDLQIPVGDRPVLLVEDIIDTGLTLRFIRRWLETHSPSSIEVVTLLDRPVRRIADEHVKYSGFVVPDRFVVGYGFDYRQQHRNLPDLHELALSDGDTPIATAAVHPS